MRLIKKIFLFSGIVLCFVVLLLSGIGFYLYSHPDQIKPMVERSLSASTGASCTIENLSYSFKAFETKENLLCGDPFHQSGYGC
jgi:hypothetical protein